MKKIIYGSLFLLLCLILISCNNSKESTSKDTTTLKVALAYKARSFNPHSHTDSATLAVTKQIYDNLFSIQEGKLINELVKNYEIKLDNSIVLTLKNGIYFHDGSELTAQDVKNSLELNLNTPVSRVLVKSIQNIEIIDKYTLKIIQNNSPSILLHNLTHSSTAIIKKIETDDEINLIGTGPYKIVNWGNGENVELESFDKYWKGKAKSKYLYFNVIPETSARIIALETGETDIAYDIVSSDIEIIKKIDKLTFINKNSLGTDFLTINTEKITDKRIRQAIEYAVDKNSIIDAVYEGYSSIPNSILTPEVFGYNKDIPIREYNVTKAKELLKEAGVKDLELNLWIYDETSRREMAQIVQANLKEVGINVNIEIAEVSTFLQYTGQGKHDMLLGLWYTSTCDADYGYYPLLHSSSKGNIGNRSFYSNTEVDKYLDEARTTTDTSKRLDYYTKAQNIISDEVPLFPISNKNYTIAMSKQVKGFIYHPNGNHILYQTYVEK